jgi:hypothetical protein
MVNKNRPVVKKVFENRVVTALLHQESKIMALQHEGSQKIDRFVMLSDQKL